MRAALLWVVAVVFAGVFAGCDNPFDPLDQSDKIEGLRYFDFSASLEQWDSNQGLDGLQMTLSYANEFGDELSFHDKPHDVQIDFYTQEGDSPAAKGILLTSVSVEVSFSDAAITIPYGVYGDFVGIPSTEAVTGCLLVHVFPPQEYPQAELTYLQCDVEFYTPEDVVL